MRILTFTFTVFMGLAVMGTVSTTYAADQAVQPKPVAASQTAQKSQTVYVGVDGMVCDFCAQSLKKVFRKQAAVKDVQISLEKKRVTLFLKPHQTIADKTIRRLVTDAGYAVSKIDRVQS